MLELWTTSHRSIIQIRGELRFQDSNLCGVAGLSHGSIDTHQQIVTLCLTILDLIFLLNVSLVFGWIPIRA